MHPTPACFDRLIVVVGFSLDKDFNGMTRELTSQPQESDGEADGTIGDASDHRA